MYATSQTPPAEDSHIFSTFTVARANEMKNNLPREYAMKFLHELDGEKFFNRKKIIMSDVFTFAILTFL